MTLPKTHQELDALIARHREDAYRAGKRRAYAIAFVEVALAVLLAVIAVRWGISWLLEGFR